MTPHAKASSAGSTSGRGSRLGSIRRAFATRGASCGANGSRAPSSGAPQYARTRTALFALAAAALSLLAFAPFASAAPKTVVNSIGAPSPTSFSTGFGGGLFNTPRGVAVNRTGAGGVPAGTIYVGDGANNRIQRFSPTGAFVSAWGWDVIRNGSPSDPGSFTGFQICTVAADCKNGTAGANPGQFGNNGMQGIAVDQSRGLVYVSDQNGRRISVFSSTGTFEGAFGFGVVNGSASFQFCTTICVTAAAAGADAGRFGSALGGLAVAASGNLYVADKTNRRVDVFAPTFAGNVVTGMSFAHAFGWGVDTGAAAFEVCTVASTCNAGATTAPGNNPGQFGTGTTSPSDVAFDAAGNVYALDPANKRVQKFSSAPAVLEASFGSAALSSTFGTGNLYSLGFDTTANRIFVSGSNSANGNQVRVAELDSTGASVDTHGTDLTITTATGLATAPATIGGNLYLTTASTGTLQGVYVLNEAPTMAPVTTFAGTTATFEGEVVSNAIAATYHFEYSVDGTNWSRFPAADVAVPAAPGKVAVSQEATGLTGSQLYQARLVQNRPLGGGVARSAPVEFTTLAAAPAVSSPTFAGVGSETATLKAQINPQNEATAYRFEYVEKAEFDANGFANATRFPAVDASLPAGSASVSVSRVVGGLKPATTYHVRAVATNTTGTTEGTGGIFTTLTSSGSAALPEGRVWERVSPVDKNGGRVLSGSFVTNTVFDRLAIAALSGDAVAYGVSGNFGGEGAPPFPEYLSRRGPDGWTTEGINPPQSPNVQVYPNASRYAWLSEDLSAGVVEATGADLNPGDPSGVPNLYRRDNASGDFQTILQGDRSILPAEYDFYSGPVAGTQDGSHIVATKHGGPDQGLMEWVAGSIRHVGVLPGGTDVTANAFLGSASTGGGSRSTAIGANAISNDGSRIFFTHDPGFGGPLYVRENGLQTTLLSGSERSGDDPAQPHPAGFELASVTGSVAVFTSPKATPLTDDALDGLYRWDSTAPAGERLTDISADTAAASPEGGTVLGTVGASDDASVVYFVDTGRLTEDASSGGAPKLYRWGDGEGVELVATLSPTTSNVGQQTDFGVWSKDLAGQLGHFDKQSPFREARVTPDGRFVAFSSRTSQTAYPTNGTKQIYLFDSASDELTCVSCGTVFTGSKADSWFLSSATEGNDDASQHLTRNLSPDGRRFFFDSRDALVPQDSNGLTDVYEWHDGQLDLISSGANAHPSRLLDVSESGDDAFFVTRQRLVASDVDDEFDVYDARVGGRSEPPVDVPCVADECQETPAPPPAFQTPASAGFSGAGNPRKRKTRCHKGKVRRAGRCVKRKRTRGQRRPGADRRAVR